MTQRDPTDNRTLMINERDMRCGGMLRIVNRDQSGRCRMMTEYRELLHLPVHVRLIEHGNQPRRETACSQLKDQKKANQLQPSPRTKWPTEEWQTKTMDWKTQQNKAVVMVIVMELLTKTMIE